MPEEYNNPYFKKLVEIIATAPKLKNSYLYITKVKIENENIARNLEKQLNQ